MPVSRRALLKSLLAGGVGATAGAGAYAVYAARTIQVTRAPLPVAGLPSRLSGLRLGLLTDPHRSQWVSHDDIAAAVTLLMAERPDLILLGGDYVTWRDRTYVDAAAEALAPLSAPHGVFAVLGNHDDERNVPAALSRRGFTVLADARTALTIRGETLEIAGIRFWTQRAGDIAPVLRGARGTVVLLAHDPRRVEEAAALGVPLVLSGHTHGGQVVLPILGAVAARKFPVLAGIGRVGGTTLFVSRGVGTVYVPVRINCPPEVAVLTLESVQPTG